jgi:uncharacterized protein (TIGR02594 family)
VKKAYELAKAEIGTVEWAQGSNPKVVAYYRDAGHPEVKDDAVAWCAAFVGAMLARAGIKPSGDLTARSYLKWGVPVDVRDAQQGDIGIIPRGSSAWQGHVFFIDRIANGKVYALGGNQRDAVNIQTYPASSLLGVRRAKTGAGTVPKPEVKPAAKPVVAAGSPPKPTKSFWGRFWDLLTGKDAA